MSVNLHRIRLISQLSARCPASEVMYIGLYVASRIVDIRTTTSTRLRHSKTNHWPFDMSRDLVFVQCQGCSHGPSSRRPRPRPRPMHPNKTDMSPRRWYFHPETRPRPIDRLERVSPTIRPALLNRNFIFYERRTLYADIAGCEWSITNQN